MTPPLRPTPVRQARATTPTPPARRRTSISRAGWVLPPLAGLLVLVAGCTSVTVRPNTRPFPGARADTLTGEADALIRRLSAEVERRGLKVRRQSTAEGYLETEWHDLRSARPSGDGHRASDRVIKLRAWADFLPPDETIVVLEAVYRRSTDPSQPSRELEVLASPSHPADSLVQQILRALEPVR